MADTFRVKNLLGLEEAYQRFYLTEAGVIHSLIKTGTKLGVSFNGGRHWAVFTNDVLRSAYSIV